MKNTLKSIIALAMVICMLFAVAGCGDKGRETSSEQTVNEDFFADAQTQEEVTSTDTSSNNSSNATSNNSSNGTSNNSSNVASNNNSNTSSGGKTSSTTTDSGSITTNVPKENQIGGKTWKEVLSTMPKKLRGTKLTMYNWNSATEYTGAPAVMDEFRKQTGIQVTWNTIPYGTYNTKLPALIASGENIPNVVRIGYAKLDFIQNMQPISVSKYDFTDQAWDQNMMKNLTFGGKTYGTTLQNTHVSGVYVLFYNKAVVDKYNYEDPYKLWKAGKWDWDKYIEMCKDAIDDGMKFGSVGEGHIPSYAASYGLTNLYYDGKKIASRWNTPEWLKVHQELCDLYYKDWVFGQGREELFDAGDCLFYVGTTVHARNKNAYFGDLKANKTLYFVPIPEHKEFGGKYYQGYGEIEAYGIPKGADNVEAVPYFLRYFLDGANYVLDTYFGNKQNLEVYNWCMNQENKIVNFGYEAPNVVGQNGINSIQKCTGAQAKSFIDSNKGVNEKWVKEQNEILNKLK